MWLPSIGKIKVALWLRENGKQLRSVAIVFAVLVCVNLLLYVFRIAPSEAKLKTWEPTSVELRMRHSEAVLFKEQKPLFAGLLAGIPEQKDMPLLVKELEQMAKKLNLTVAAINYDIPQRESGELAMLSFSFPVEGRYPDIKRFIYEVETSGRLIGIQDVKLESDKGRVKLQMKLMTYVRGN
ncbi:MAG: type 4a pilus biogenesis protein PilO [Nitrospirae bacterium]|nr:type 4a pilus biogenesis protein PilO [Nitrospirota bacterium]